MPMFCQNTGNSMITANECFVFQPKEKLLGPPSRWKEPFLQKTHHDFQNEESAKALSAALHLRLLRSAVKDNRGKTRGQ